MRNLGEIFLSKIPPSLVNFREWVSEEDESTMGSRSHKFGGDHIMNPKARFDIEIGGKLSKDGSFSVNPNIMLQKIDYGAINESLKEGGGNIGFDPFIYSASQKERHWKMANGDGTVEDCSNKVSSTNIVEN